MKYQVCLSNRKGYIKPLVLRPELNIFDAAYWAARIGGVHGVGGLAQDIEDVPALQVRTVVRVVK